MLVRQMLDTDLDPIWIAQAQKLHGPELDFPEVRRSRIAMCDGGIAGIGTIAGNPIHPGRYSSAIEVHPAFRRRHIGSLLLTTLLDLRLEPIPLATKISAFNAVAMAYARNRNGTNYQTCPGISIDLSLPSVHNWIDVKLAVSSADIRPVAGIDQTRIVESFVDQYLWVHEGWSPVGSIDALRRTATSICQEADPALSSILEQDGQIAVGVHVFRVGETAEIVAETTRQKLPGGRDLLELSIATSLRACSLAGIRSVEFDGHVTDPHLYPILESLPDHRPNPLFLVEFS